MPSQYASGRYCGIALATARGQAGKSAQTGTKSCTKCYRQPTGSCPCQGDNVHVVKSVVPAACRPFREFCQSRPSPYSSGPRPSSHSRRTRSSSICVRRLPAAASAICLHANTPASLTGNATRKKPPLVVSKPSMTCMHCGATNEPCALRARRHVAYRFPSCHALTRPDARHTRHSPCTHSSCCTSVAAGCTALMRRSLPCARLT